MNRRWSLCLIHHVSGWKSHQLWLTPRRSSLPMVLLPCWLSCWFVAAMKVMSSSIFDDSWDGKASLQELLLGSFKMFQMHFILNIFPPCLGMLTHIVWDDDHQPDHCGFLLRHSYASDPGRFLPPSLVNPCWWRIASLASGRAPLMQIIPWARHDENLRPCHALKMVEPQGCHRRNGTGNEGNHGYGWRDWRICPLQTLVISDHEHKDYFWLPWAQSNHFHQY